MSFFSALGKIIQGKPVFTNEAAGQAPQPVPIPPSSGRKELPVVTIEECFCRLQGTSEMECEVQIKNHSSQLIELDKIRILGTVHEIDHHLRPGEEREYEVYSGPRPQNTYETRCELIYKNRAGDYFSTLHYVEFQQQPDRTYIIRRLRYGGIVRDI